MMTVCNYNYCTHTVSRRIWINPYFTQIRLSGGATVNQGLVDVYCNGRWGTLCDSGKNNADTVCRQLGYESAYRYNHLSMSVIKLFYH